MKKSILKMLVISITFIVLDQLTKYLATIWFLEEKQLIPGIFSMEYQQNTGVAFSIPFPRLITILATYLFLALGFYLAYSELNLKKGLSQFFVAIIFGGAVSNLIDRSLHSYVIDFIVVWKWPVFNLADIGIVAGALGILVFYGKINKTKNI